MDCECVSFASVTHHRITGEEFLRGICLDEAGLWICLFLIALTAVGDPAWDWALVTITWLWTLNCVRIIEKCS